MLCVLIRIASSNEYTQHSIILQKIPKLYQFFSWSGVMIDPQWLGLPMSKTNLYGPKDVRVIEVWL